MQRVVRSTLVGLLAVAGLTACGDKVTPVTITNTTTPPPAVVHSVTVSPASVSVQVGATAQLAASVDADAGVTDRTVTWSSSDNNTATVTSAGVVTGVKAGAVTIIASAKAAPTVQGAAAVTVTAVGGGAVPTVTISGLTTTLCPVGGGTCSSVPANLQNFGTGSNAPAGQTGQLDVILNVDSQGAVLKSVSAILKCGNDSLVQVQTISGAAAPLGAEASSAPVTFSFNTAAFNSTTGVAALHNGTCTIGASASTAAGTQSAASSQQLTLNNADVIFATLSASKGPKSDAGGRSWFGGDVTVNVVPVFYTAGRSAVSALVAVTGTDTTGTPPAPALPAAQALATFPGSVTFSGSKTTAKGGLLGVTLVKLGANVTIVDNSGNTFAPVATVSGPTRLDNQAPAKGTYTLNGKQGNNNNWVGSAYAFSTASGKGYATAGDNNGVDNVGVVFQYTTVGSTTWTTVVNASDIAATNVSTADTLRFIETDALGNADTVGVSKFGVDLNAPSLSLKTGTTLAANTVCNTLNCSGNIQANVTDDFSGPDTTFMAITRQNTGVTTNATQCVLGTAKSSGSTAFGNVATYNPDGSVTGACVPIGIGVGTQAKALNQGHADGYYTVSVFARDQAGNVSADSLFMGGEDAQVPVQGGVAIPATFTGGGAVTFPTAATDNMDLTKATATLNYPAPASMGLYYANTLPGVEFDNVLTNSASYSFSISNFITSLQQVTVGNAPPTLAVKADTDATRPTGLTLTSFDEASNPSNVVTALFGASSFSGAAAYQANANFQTWTVSPAGAVSVHNAKDSTNTVTLKGIASGPSGVFNVPFASVTIYYQVNGAGVWFPIGTVTGAAAADDGTTRTWTYSLSWDPPTKAPDGTSLTTGTATVLVRAVGQDAAGNALTTNSSGTITLTNP